MGAETSERVVHDVTSRDQRGGVSHEHTMGSVGFLSRPERADPPCESWKFAMEEKWAQAQISHPRGPEVRAIATRREIGAKICQALWPSFSKKSIRTRHMSGQLSLKPVHCQPTCDRMHVDCPVSQSVRRAHAHDLAPSVTHTKPPGGWRCGRERLSNGAGHEHAPSHVGRRPSIDSSRSTGRSSCALGG